MDSSSKVDFVILDEHLRAARDLVGDDDWQAMSSEQKNIRGLVEFLTEELWTMDFREVEFVRFDEELYQCLVDHGCVAVRNKKPARVELTPAALNHYL